MATKKSQQKSVEELLQEKFRYSDIEFVIVNAFDYNGYNGYEIKAFALPYIKKESGEKRLDDVFGVNNWENDFTFPDSAGRIKYKIKYRVPGSDEWREKNEAATIDTSERGQFSKTAFESGLAFAEKRCIAKLGIGRYLKLSPNLQVEVSEGFQPGWNKYSFKSKVDKDQYVSIYWKEPILPIEFLHEDDAHLADEVNETQQKQPPPQKKNDPQHKVATDAQWEIIETYYKALPLEEQNRWTGHLYNEQVDDDTGSVSTSRKKLSQHAVSKVIKSFEKGYGELVDGHPSKLPLSHDGVQQSRDLYEEPPKQ